MSNVIALIGTLVCVCILFAAWIAFTERGKGVDDAFRRRWGGSDVRELHEPMARWRT
jgi:archaellum component FlaF (FlaF/FlaG flagellin family)